MKHLEDVGLCFDLESAEKITLNSRHYTPIDDIGEEAPGFCKFCVKARYLLINEVGEVETDDYLLFNVFASSESDAKQKIADYFKKLNDEAEKQDFEVELIEVNVWIRDGSVNGESNITETTL